MKLDNNTLWMQIHAQDMMPQLLERSHPPDEEIGFSRSNLNLQPDAAQILDFAQIEQNEDKTVYEEDSEN